MNAEADTIGDTSLNEYLIQHCYRKMLDAKTHADQRHWFQRMGFYVALRSPEKVQQLERDRGLT